MPLAEFMLTVKMILSEWGSPSICQQCFLRFLIFTARFEGDNLKSVAKLEVD